MGFIYPVELPVFPLTKSVTATLVANNTTASIILWTITGNIIVASIHGIVTTVLSSSVTAAHLRLNDATNTPAITLATGTTLSNMAGNSMIGRTAAPSTALSATSAGTNPPYLASAIATGAWYPFSGGFLTAKNGTTCNIEFRYTCLNQSSGAIKFYMTYALANSTSTVV